MEPLVRASLALRALLRRAHGSVAALGFASFLVLGGVRGEWGPVYASIAGAWGLLLVVRIRRKLREPGDAGMVLDFEIGALAAVGLYAALVRVDGGLSGPLSPLLYVLVAFVAAFGQPSA